MQGLHEGERQQEKVGKQLEKAAGRACQAPGGQKAGAGLRKGKHSPRTVPPANPCAPGPGLPSDPFRAHQRLRLREGGRPGADVLMDRWEGPRGRGEARAGRSTSFLGAA